MNVLVLHGSPRRDGNTAALARAFLEGLAASGGHEVHEVFLDGLRLGPCRNCDACRREGAGASPPVFCRIDDDMRPLYPRFVAADLVVIGSPVYWWSVSAQVKLFVDRLYGLDVEGHPERMAGKGLVLALTYGGEEPNSGPQLIEKMFSDIAEYAGMRLEAVLRACTGERAVKDDPARLAEARSAGLRVGRA